MFEWIVSIALITVPLQSASNVSTASQTVSTGSIGAYAAILENGAVVLERNPARHYPMQSVYKLPIAMTALDAVDKGKLSLDQIVRVPTSQFISQRQHSPLRDNNPAGAEVQLQELLRLAVEESDGTASDVLLELIGGPQNVMKYLQTLGITEVVVHDSEKLIGSDNAIQYANWATPRSAARLLSILAEGKILSIKSNSLLFRWMTETQTGPHRIKGKLPQSAVVAHKTGSSGIHNGIAAATNDIGIVKLPDGRYLVIAVFVSDSAQDVDARETLIADIAKEAWDKASRN